MVNAGFICGTTMHQAKKIQSGLGQRASARKFLGTKYNFFYNDDSIGLSDDIKIFGIQ
jgi:hypothetical protein